MLSEVGISDGKFPIGVTTTYDLDNAADEYVKKHSWKDLNAVGRDVGEKFCGSKVISTLTPPDFARGYPFLMYIMEAMVGAKSFTNRSEEGEAEFGWPAYLWPFGFKGGNISVGEKYLLSGAAGGSSVLHRTPMRYRTNKTRNGIVINEKSIPLWEKELCNISEMIEKGELI